MRLAPTNALHPRALPSLALAGLTLLVASCSDAGSPPASVNPSVTTAPTSASASARPSTPATTAASSAPASPVSAPAPVSGELCRATVTGDRISSSCPRPAVARRAYNVHAECAGGAKASLTYRLVDAKGAPLSSGRVPCGKPVQNTALPGSRTKAGQVRLEVDATGVTSGYVVVVPEEVY